jgi:hypothetical protein
MVPLTSLWLPILVSAILVFIASSLIWTVINWHRNDFRQLPDEAALLDEMERRDIPPGQYTFPWMPSSKMTPELQARFEKGPAGHMVVFPRGPWKMGKQLSLWFLYCIIVSIFVAYLAGRTLPPGAYYLQVFRIAGTAAVLTYAGALAQNSIWFGRPWSATSKDIADGVIYGLLTAGTFGWLWPS